MNLSRLFRFVSAGLVCFVVLIIVAGLTLSGQGRKEMRLSDSAFDEGDMRNSLTHARKAALAYVPGAEHVRDAYLRIEAIARGAESEDDLVLALSAWDTLRLVHERTRYPGRASSDVEARANEGLRRLRSRDEDKDQ